MIVLVAGAPGILVAASAGFLPPLGGLATISESATLVWSGLALMLIARFARRVTNGPA